MASMSNTKDTSIFLKKKGLALTFTRSNEAQYSNNKNLLTEQKSKIYQLFDNNIWVTKYKFCCISSINFRPTFCIIFQFIMFSLKVHPPKTIPVNLPIPQVYWLFFLTWWKKENFFYNTIFCCQYQKYSLCQLQWLLETQHAYFGPHMFF